MTSNPSNDGETSIYSRNGRRSRRPQGSYSLLILLLGAVFLFTGLGAGAPSSQALQSGVFALLPEPDEGMSDVLARSPLAFDTPDLIIIDSSSMIAATPPGTVGTQTMGSFGGGSYQEDPEGVPQPVRHDDTIASFAERHGIKEETVMWSNSLSRDADLSDVEELRVFYWRDAPIDGALHSIRSGESLSHVAEWYEADLQSIKDFNGLDSEDKIVSGDLLFIPEGKKPDSLPSLVEPSSPAPQGPSRSAARAPVSTPAPASRPGFVSPTGTLDISQGLHHYNAVDIRAPYGSPVYASSSGTIQRVGYHPIGGNYVRVLHSGGVVTYYGHLSGFAVSNGQSVSQGQVIGYIGLTGLTTGPHVHFEVRGAANPFAR